ncbi:S8 family serine peptidase [Niallia sp. 01092]|uniref:S8 family serine peptidase n=1 Tax=unclassified Niallia TaxID=2837522 RepID=UPI003FD3324B
MRRFSTPFLLIVFIAVFTSCTQKNSEIVLNSKDCERNWAVCNVLESKKIKMPDKANIKIAILDSGINRNHEAIKAQVKKTYNATNGQKKTYDSFGHGTAIAGIIAAKPNKENVIGIFPSAHLYDVQVLDKNGSGKIEDVVKGIRWSIEQKVDIINISFGFQKNSEVLEKAINDALEKGIIIVAAAGNTFGLYTDYPAKYPGVISISAVDKEFNHYSLAATGKINLVAPGVDIPIIGRIRGKNIVSGTSFATAYATGIIAFNLSNGSPKTNILSSNLLKIKELDNKKYTGKGFLYIP